MVPNERLRSDFRVELLSKTHDRAAFSCGIDALDRYLKAQAGQDVAKRVAVCFVLTPDGTTIAGLYTLSQYSVDLLDLPAVVASKLPRYPEVPATLLGRLAISQAFKGRRLGEFLLLDGLYRGWQQSKQVASVAVIVDAKDESARRFYEHFGFLSLPSTPNRLFLPMKVIDRLFSE